MTDRLNYEQAAAYLGIKLATLRSMVCRKQVPHMRLTARLVVFDRAQLDAWLGERSVAAIAPSSAYAPELEVVKGGRS